MRAMCDIDGRPPLVPRHGEGVRCGRGGFFKRSQRSEALQCYHMFANTKKAPFQRFCFLS